ncbi:MAG: hypothetical protein KF760_09440 [Candidatus Eremiobacteraeota bacterium]|nr:hypothetical protein [Candidatus Eremiobacteraeota bacterium]MCW5866252.1 hypothetical protein [Candidatus Eremiobacteraeota bacterium]
MITVVATYDRQTGACEVHLALSSALDKAERRSLANAKVEELSQKLDSERFEVIYSVARTVDDFVSTDGRFQTVRYAPGVQ